jgi:hypothetical protein
MARATMALVVLLAAPAWGAALHLSSANVAQPGDVATVCASLDSQGAEIAGTQNDLIWDGACATLGACRVEPSTGKDLSGRLQNSEDFRYRLLVLSLTDVDPIPDGRLYCCDFEVDAAPRSCCEVRTVNAGAADPNGNALSLALGAPAQLCVGALDGTPFVTATPTFTPTPRPSPADPACLPDDCVFEPNGESGANVAAGDGCQIVNPRAAAAWPLFLLVPLLWWRQRLGARAARPQR